MRVLHAIATLAVVVPGGLGPTRCDPIDHRPDVAIGAITADGTTLYLPAGGTPIELIYDGASTAEPHSVAITPDGRRAWVTECCEPVWGQWWEIDIGVGPRNPIPGNGYAFDLNDSADLLTSIGYYGVAIRTLDGSIVAEAADLDTLPVPRDPYDTAWVDDDRVAFLELAQPNHGNEFRLVVTDAALTGYRNAAGAVVGTNIEAPWPRLAGTDAEHRIMILQPAGPDRIADLVHAHDPATLQRVPSADIHLPKPATWAWIDGDHVIWIDRHQRLRVNGETIAGRYEWACSA